MDYIEPSEISYEEGVFLVRLARKAVEEYLRGHEIINPPNDTPQKLLRKGMSFVTILKPSALGRYELRGCIGYLQPIEPLARNVINAAIAAATEDPRFLPLSTSELGSVIFEVSVLSMPKAVVGEGWGIVSDVTIGTDGLVVEYGIYRGLLLPEVPVEYCWDEETFLSETCIKAGMDPDCWLHPKVKIQKFYATVFREEVPYGNVVRRDLALEYRNRCKGI